MKGTEKIPTEFDKNEKQKRVFVFDFTFSHQTGRKMSSKTKTRF